jgi:hypothetical protein
MQGRWCEVHTHRAMQAESSRPKTTGLIPLRRSYVICALYAWTHVWCHDAHTHTHTHTHAHMHIHTCIVPMQTDTVPKKKEQIVKCKRDIFTQIILYGCHVP